MFLVSTWYRISVRISGFDLKSRIRTKVHIPSANLIGRRNLCGFQSQKSNPRSWAKAIRLLKIKLNVNDNKCTKYEAFNIRPVSAFQLYTKQYNLYDGTFEKKKLRITPVPIISRRRTWFRIITECKMSSGANRYFIHRNSNTSVL